MRKRRIIKVAIALIVIGSAAAYILYQAVQSSWAYYYSVDEFVETALSPASQSCDRLPPACDNRTIRLAGCVKRDSIAADRSERLLFFELAGQRSSISVTYQGPIPANFAADKEVVVEGRLNAQGLFEAVRIMTRCESKYRTKLPQKSPEP